MGKTTKRRKKLTALGQQKADKRRRIDIMKNRAKAEKIIQTEEKWIELQMEGRAVELLRYPHVERLLNGAAFGWSQAYRDKRLTYADFHSEFLEVVWLTIVHYEWASDFFLYEKIRKAIESRGKSLLRSTEYDVRKAFHEAVPLKNDFDEFMPDSAPSIEDIVTERLYIEQELTELERDVLTVIKEGGSQREASDLLGEDRRKVSKTVIRLREKLEPYYTA
ncbi:hypothetical protein MO973_09160 [Paenibacillus sp. TRM 82003]|nr:hypothetical protein [Paenibacillus sp. TRM 82003]